MMTSTWFKSIQYYFYLSLITSVGYTQPTVQHLLEYGPPSELSGSMAATVTFLQVANTSGGTDASNVSKVTLRYFTSTNCSGSSAGDFTTPDGTVFSINKSTSFNLNAESTYNVGNNPPLSLNMSTIKSVAIFFKSTNSNTPQANFTGSSCGTNPSFCCVRINCSNGTECTQSSPIGTQNFQLKTTAVPGDPADGGIIGCMGGGLNNLVVTISNQSEAQIWGGSGTTTGTTSTTDGATNTATIVNCLTNGIGSGCTGGIAANTYAAGNCSTYSTSGGFTNGWFLPSGGNVSTTQIRCLYNNATAIATGSVAAGGAGFATSNYWSSTEANATTAWRLSFFTGNPSMNDGDKTNTFRVRCVRAF